MKVRMGVATTITVSAWSSEVSRKGSRGTATSNELFSIHSRGLWYHTEPLVSSEAWGRDTKYWHYIY
uniref:Uncharacterized protein n=1 Tax=Anguilla anguilla TaxID=7936 RepID=A0A0E9WIU3_ANGAN